MKKLAYLFTIVSAQLGAMHFHRTRSAKEVPLAFPKLFAGALALLTPCPPFLLSGM